MASLSLRVCFADSRWAWYLKDQDAIDVYLGAEFVTTLPATLVRQMVSHYVTHAHLTAAVLDTREPLQPAPPRAALPSVGVPSRPIQAARKAQRHARLGRPHKRRPA